MVTSIKIENETFFYDSSIPCIIDVETGFMPSGEFRAHMEKGLEVIREKIKEQGKLGWLADLIKADIFEAQDTQWLIEYWNVKAHEAGVKYIALVMPESIFAELNITEYTQLSNEENGGLTTSCFKDTESAKGWLKEVLAAE